MINLEEVVEEYVQNNPLKGKELVLEGEGYKLYLVPEDFFGSQPTEFVEDHSWAGPESPCHATTEGEPLGPDSSYWACTRKAGHPGPHVAGYDTNNILQVW